MPADIGLTIDANSGQAVSGRRPSVALPTGPLAVLGTPRGIMDETLKPWVVSFKLPGESAARAFKVVETLPDKLGLIVCYLEDYL